MLSHSKVRKIEIAHHLHTEAELWAYNHEWVKYWLRENIKRSPRLQEIADKFNLPPETLRRYFSRREGKSISQFIDDELLRAVQHELLVTQRRCNEIARDFNFSYETHAERWFKRRTNMTMMEYRKSNGVQCEGVNCVDETRSVEDSTRREVGSQMSEVRSQKSEVRGQQKTACPPKQSEGGKTENRKQKTENRKQKTENRKQKTETPTTNVKLDERDFSLTVATSFVRGTPRRFNCHLWRTTRLSQQTPESIPIPQVVTANGYRK